MLLNLAMWLQSLNPEWGFLRVFQYLTFRAVMAAVTALLIGLVLGPFVIRKLTELKVGQPIREYGMQSHLAKRAAIYTGQQPGTRPVVLLAGGWKKRLGGLPIERDQLLCDTGGQSPRSRAPNKGCRCHTQHTVFCNGQRLEPDGGYGDRAHPRIQRIGAGTGKYRGKLREYISAYGTDVRISFDRRC